MPEERCARCGKIFIKHGRERWCVTCRAEREEEKERNKRLKADPLLAAAYEAKKGGISYGQAQGEKYMRENKLKTEKTELDKLAEALEEDRRRRKEEGRPRVGRVKEDKMAKVMEKDEPLSEVFGDPLIPKDIKANPPASVRAAIATRIKEITVELEELNAWMDACGAKV